MSADDIMLIDVENCMCVGNGVKCRECQQTVVPPHYSIKGASYCLACGEPYATMKALGT